MLHDMESSSHHECLAETRVEWIAEIIAWAQSGSVQNILWVNGIPGCGKSTIALTVARHPAIVPRLLAHIFLKRENTRRHDLLKVVSYILK